MVFNNVIIVDYDGVCAWWEQAFDMWMLLKGHAKETAKGEYEIYSKYGIGVEEGNNLVAEFNASSAIENIPPYKDSIKYIKKLHEEHGFVFHCITAITNNKNVYDMRMKNIENLFGKTAFQRLILTNDSASKPKSLEFYADSGCHWIEDVPKNAEYGLDFGLSPILLTHHYNKDYTNPHEIKIVDNWKEIYHHIIGE
jgi:hypothetical protein